MSGAIERALAAVDEHGMYCHGPLYRAFEGDLTEHESEVWHSVQLYLDEDGWPDPLVVRSILTGKPYGD